MTAPPYIVEAERHHAEHAARLVADLHPGAAAALAAAKAQSYCSGHAPSDYLLDALRAAIAVEVSVCIKTSAEHARWDERRELLAELGADPAWHSRPTREAVKAHVRWLEQRAARKAGPS